MAKTKIYKKGITYYSTKKNIQGLCIGGNRNSGFTQNFYVVEDNDPKRSLVNRTIPFQGTLPECRDYLKQRFAKKNK